MLPDDGENNETCWRYFHFNVNFNTPLKTNSLVYQLVIQNVDNSRMHGTNVKIPSN